VERRAAALLAHSVSEIIDAGGGVRLLSEHTRPRNGVASATVVMVHGWEGSAQSMYMLSVATRLWEGGCRVIRLNLRDHGDSHHLNRELFHSCRLDEVVGAVHAVQQRFPDEQLALAGFSLGGNFVLRVAARSPSIGLHLSRVLAICPVLDPRETLRALDGGFPLYRHYFLQKWRGSLLRKQAAFPGVYNFGALSRFHTLRSMTDYFVTHHTEYPDLDAYLDGYAITGARLAGLEVPSHVLLADDDPVIPVSDASRLARSPALTLVRSRFGGHCGFLTTYGLQSWLDEYIARVLLLSPQDIRSPADQSLPPGHPRTAPAA
jgi:hypothetical protein